MPPDVAAEVLVVMKITLQAREYTETVQTMWVKVA